MDDLIQMAGKALFFQVEKLLGLSTRHFGNFQQNSSLNFLFLLGPGNNGRDGIDIKNRLVAKYPHFVVTDIFFDPASNSFSKANWNELINQQTIIIDALFGVGLNKNIQGALKKQIQELNKVTKETNSLSVVISIDIPSGIDSDTGAVLGTAINADYTLSCELPKVGLFLNHGPLYAGKILKVPLGIPLSYTKEIANSIRLVQRKNVKSLFPKKSILGNKTKYGHLLIVAGSKNMLGALRLCSLAAARSGVGYVTLVIEEEWYQNSNLFKELFPDFILIEKKTLLKKADSEILKKYSAVLIGPGLSSCELNKELFKKLVTTKIRMLIDAEGINFVKELNLSFHENILLTPHAGELSRLINLSSTQIEQDRLSACEVFYEKFKNAYLLLKGHKTIVATPSKRYIIASGNKSLSKAGTGDVLAGIISSLMAQGLSLDKAAVLGAFIHGDLADQRLRNGKTISSLMASDLLDALTSYEIR